MLITRLRPSMISRCRRPRLHTRRGRTETFYVTRRLASLSILPFPLDARIRQRDEQSSVSQQIMATSSVSAINKEINSGVLRRLIDWLHRCWKYLWQGTVFIVRGTEICLRLAPLSVMAPLSIFSTRFLGFGGPADFSWWYFTYSMQALGPAFVKLCQWAATRRDVFPPHVCIRLSSLHDDGSPHAWRYSDRTLREAFGDDYMRRGLVVDRKVIGCGSAGQVYAGTLEIINSKNNETETRSVAIKILHPRYAKLVHRDLQLMHTAAGILHSLPSETIQMLNFPRVAQNFDEILSCQSDLRIEGRNLEQFRTNFYRNRKDEFKSSILFPRPEMNWTTEQVLVEGLATDSRPISDYLNDSSPESIAARKGLAGPLLRGFLKMVFLDNFVHLDLHPGNVLVQTTYDKPQTFWGGSDPNAELQSKRTIVFLDAGIATSLSKNDQRNLIDLFRAVLTNDGYEAGRLMVERAKFERCSSVPGGTHAFATGVGKLVAEFHDNRKAGLTLGAVRIGSLLSRVLDLCRLHGVEIDPSMASIVVSTLVLEGLGRSLDPDLNLIDFAMPFVLGRGRV